MSSETADTIPAPFVGPIRETEYRCAKCGGVYLFTTDGIWDDATALKEAAEEFPEIPPTEDSHDLLCDDCYKAFMAWFENPPDAGHRA